MSTATNDVVYVDADVPPAANYTGRQTLWPRPDVGVQRVQRPPLTGHVHLRTSDRCLHNDGGPLCPPLARP